MEAHEGMCVKREVGCPNIGCIATRIAFDVLAAHRITCEFETVACPFAGVGCMDRMQRKDVDAHKRDAMGTHNELLLARVCGMQQEVTAVNAGLSASKKEVKALQKEAAKEVIVLQIKHAELTGADRRTRINSEQRVVDGRMFRVYVETSNPNYYGVYLQLTNGPLPSKVKIAFELVHHDGQAASAKKMSSTSSHTYTEKHGVVGYSQFVPKARLADAATSPYVKNGYVTFKCTLEVVE
jgi:hypothetical protein